MTADSWNSFQKVWAVVGSDLGVQLYATRKEAENARRPEERIQPLPVWHEGLDQPEPAEVPTPYDVPDKLFDRVVFPSARLAYRQGYAAARAQAEGS